MWRDWYMFSWPGYVRRARRTCIKIIGKVIPVPVLGKLKLEPMSRYTACKVLRDTGIPSTIWAEDACEKFGVPTMVFDLFLLVDDPEQAAKALEGAGYERIPINSRFRDIPELSEQVPRLGLPARSPFFSMGRNEEQNWDLNPTSTVLLPCKSWDYELPASVVDMDGAYPTLPDFVNSLMRTWLNCHTSSWRLREHIGTLIVYLYGYLTVFDDNFVENLRLEHRQMHFDLLAMDEPGQPPFNCLSSWEHHLQIRDAIIAGKHTPSATLRSTIPEQIMEEL